VPLIRTLDARSTGNTKCDVNGCAQPATTLVSQQGQFNSSYERQHLCELHARAAAWKAQQSGVSFEIFDIKTGGARQDLRPSGATQQYQFKH
jgi:hypothetical protein